MDPFLPHTLLQSLANWTQFGLSVQSITVSTEETTKCEGRRLEEERGMGWKVKDKVGLWEEELKRKKKVHLLSLEVYMLASEC